MDSSQPPAVRRSALIGWRVLALVYDLFPALGLWFLVGVIALAMQRGMPVHGDTVAGWMELLALWAVTGVYAIASWRGGGQTLGMRPWHLRVTAADGGRAEVPALIRRYAMGTVSLLLLGAGFWLAWVDRDRLTWHDRFSATRLVRLNKDTLRNVD